MFLKKRKAEKKRLADENARLHSDVRKLQAQIETIADILGYDIADLDRSDVFIGTSAIKLQGSPDGKGTNWVRAV